MVIWKGFIVPGTSDYVVQTQPASRKMHTLAGKVCLGVHSSHLSPHILTLPAQKLSSRPVSRTSVIAVVHWHYLWRRYRSFSFVAFGGPAWINYNRLIVPFKLLNCWFYINDSLNCVYQVLCFVYFSDIFILILWSLFE